MHSRLAVSQCRSRVFSGSCKDQHWPFSRGISPKEHLPECSSFSWQHPCAQKPLCTQAARRAHRGPGRARAGQSLTRREQQHWTSRADRTCCNKSPHCRATQAHSPSSQLHGWRKPHVTGWLREKQQPCFPPAAKPPSVLVSVVPNPNNFNPSAFVVFHLFPNSSGGTEWLSKKHLRNKSVQFSSSYSSVPCFKKAAVKYYRTYRLLCTSHFSKIMCNRFSSTLMSKEI